VLRAVAVAENRERILTEAARLFWERGVFAVAWMP
jgi:hypothetical protein